MSDAARVGWHEGQLGEIQTAPDAPCVLTRWQRKPPAHVSPTLFLSVLGTRTFNAYTYLVPV